MKVWKNILPRDTIEDLISEASPSISQQSNNQILIDYMILQNFFVSKQRTRDQIPVR